MNQRTIFVSTKIHRLPAETFSWNKIQNLSRLFSLIVLFLFRPATGFSQTICNAGGNIALFSNYDGGIININVDQNIPNLIIAISTYEPVQINITGTFSNNVSQVIYAGNNSNQNNNNCNLGNFSTTVTGVNPAIVTVNGPLNPPQVGYTPVHNNGSGGWNGSMVGAAGLCDTTINAGGANTPDELVYYFTNTTGGQLLFHNTQYGCWQNQTYNISGGGNCCIQPPCGKPSTPLITSVVPANCTSTVAVVNLSGLPATGIWTVTALPALAITTGSGSAGAIQGLTSGGTFSFTVKSFSNCPSDPSATITIPSANTVQPAFVINQLGVLNCSNGSVQLSVSPAQPNFGYNWQNGSSQTASLVVSSAGNYSVTVTDQVNGCASASNISVSANTIAPSVSVSALQGLSCTNTSVPVFASSNLQNAVYLWQPSSFSSSSISITNPGNYSLTATNPLNGCASTLAFVISQNISAPSVSVVVSGKLSCTNSLVVLSTFGSTAGLAYKWLPSNIITNTLQVSLPGTYTVQVTNPQNGCSSRFSAIVLKESASDFTVGTTGNLCAGKTITLQASTALSYSWSGPANFTSSLQNPSLENIQSSNSGTYFLTLVSNQGCTYNKILSIRINELPGVNINSDRVEVCEGASFNLSGKGNAISFTWFGPNNFSQLGANLILDNVMISQAGTYTLLVTDSNNCTSSFSRPVIVKTKPESDFQVVKEGSCAPLCIEYSFSPSTAIDSYRWKYNGVSMKDSSLQRFKRCVETGGSNTVSLEATGKNGCSSVSSRTVQYSSKPEVDFVFNPVRPILDENGEVTFQGLSNTGVINDWQWYSKLSDSTLIETKGRKYTQTFGAAGIFPVVLVATDLNNCRDTVVKYITIEDNFNLFVPNSFTPNGDGNNDCFAPKGHGIATYKLEIFNRWGKVIFFSESLGDCWDGTAASNQVADGVYVCKITATDFRSKVHYIAKELVLIK